MRHFPFRPEEAEPPEVVVTPPEPTFDDIAFLRQLPPAQRAALLLSLRETVEDPAVRESGLVPEEAFLHADRIFAAVPLPDLTDQERREVDRLFS